MRESIEYLRERLKDREARHEYADAFLNMQMAAQIKMNREARGMNQQALADAIGTKQSGVSRLENVNYSSWKVDTLRRVARAFGLWLDISFREFGDLPYCIEEFNRENLTKRPFDDDPQFLGSAQDTELAQYVGRLGSAQSWNPPTSRSSDVNLGEPSAILRSSPLPTPPSDPMSVRLDSALAPSHGGVIRGGRKRKDPKWHRMKARHRLREIPSRKVA